jgi:hypothetical protein
MARVIFIFKCPCLHTANSTVLSIVHFVHEELNLMRNGHPVQPVKINMIQAVDTRMSRDVAVIVYDQIPKYVQNVDRGVVT